MQVFLSFSFGFKRVSKGATKVALEFSLIVYQIPSIEMTDSSSIQSDLAKCSWTKNLSRRDSTRLPTATYLASPRMWPVGYILGSQYSPLNLEQVCPEINWRDRFEDLLALETGEKMISAVSRQNEAAAVARICNEIAHDEITHVNQELQRNQDYVTLLQRMREVSVRRKDTASVSMIDSRVLPYLKESSETAIAKGKASISGLKALQNKPASSCKRGLTWITSLISSGAMPAWHSVIYDSDDGLLADVYKADSSGDGQFFSEMNLFMTFTVGSGLNLRAPSWSTFDGSYNEWYRKTGAPHIESVCPQGDADPVAAHTYNTIRNLRPSMISQRTRVQRKTSWNGNIETRVVLLNRFTDGKEEEKTIVNDAPKMLEEVQRFQVSIKQRHRAISLAFWELSYRKQREYLNAATEMEDEGVD